MVGDATSGVVVGDVGARFPTLHREEGTGLERSPSPLPEGAPRLDPVGDPVPFPDDRDLVLARAPVDRLGHRPLEPVRQHAVQDADVRAIFGFTCVRRRAGRTAADEGGEDQRQGESEELAATRGLPGHVSAVHIFYQSPDLRNLVVWPGTW